MFERDDTPALYALMITPDSERCHVALEFCREHDVLGLGWGVGSAPADWDSYRERAVARAGGIHAAVQEIYDLPIGSLVWARDPFTRDYYVARVTGPWRYLHGPAAVDADVQNVRPAQIVRYKPTGHVPNAIVNCFVGNWVIQRLYDQLATSHSAQLFDQLTSTPDQRPLTLEDILANHLGDDQVRTLVAHYLHYRHGYMLRPPRLRSLSGAWEYVARDGLRREAIIRAGRGFSPVPRAAAIPDDAEIKLFAFSPTDTYGPDPHPNLIEIARDDIVTFIQAHPDSLPPHYQQWATAPSVTTGPVR